MRVSVGLKKWPLPAGGDGSGLMKRCSMGKGYLSRRGLVTRSSILKRPGMHKGRGCCVMRIRIMGM